MTALSANALLPAPQMMSMAFSVTEVVTAENAEELAQALRALRESIDVLRNAFGKAKKAAAVAAEPHEQTVAELRGALDSFLVLEQAMSRARNLLAKGLHRDDVRASLSGPDVPLSYRELVDFLKDLDDDYLRFVRECRLALIMTVASRAQRSGLNVLDASGDFVEAFRNATIEETEGWQETAYLLADVDYATALDQSMKSASQDRSHDLVTPS